MSPLPSITTTWSSSNLLPLEVANLDVPGLGAKVFQAIVPLFKVIVCASYQSGDEAKAVVATPTPVLFALIVTVPVDLNL